MPILNAVQVRGDLMVRVWLSETAQGKARPFRLSDLVEPAAAAAPAPPPPKMEEGYALQVDHLHDMITFSHSRTYSHRNAKLLVTFREVVDARYEADLVGGKGLKLAQVAKSLGDDRYAEHTPHLYIHMHTQT